jgi:hypothetical protein
VTDAYKARMRRNLEDLQDYGIVLTVNANLCHKVNKVYTASFDFAKPGSDKDTACQVQAPGSQQKSAGGSAKLDKKVIGRIDIARYLNCETIMVRSDALITGLARDEALKRGINIVRE